ncbi:hypothetical protein BRADI_3g27745v3 [Brachypodium distachyon]|uniref:Uncharacterized protein n=1 Tax=Brachypodium distachyon TaxID=15368 RepID=A0A2K2CZL7_BRADI|nr:hypothetical protein BRADI_3g27745v3 [Brachypodium distachyon]
MRSRPPSRAPLLAPSSPPLLLHLTGVAPSPAVASRSAPPVAAPLFLSPASRACCLPALAPPLLRLSAPRSPMRPSPSAPEPPPPASALRALLSPGVPRSPHASASASAWLPARTPSLPAPPSAARARDHLLPASVPGRDARLPWPRADGLPRLLAPHQPPLPPARRPEQARLAQAQARSKPRPVPSFLFSSFPEIIKILTCGPCWSAPPVVLSLLRVHVLLPHLIGTVETNIASNLRAGPVNDYFAATTTSPT